jgi:archaeal flagellar protein FlaI
LNREDDDTLEDVNSLMNLIGGKKKDAPPRTTGAEKAPATAGAPAADTGDFSALMKKLGMTNKPEPAPVAVRPPAERGRPSITPPDPLDSLFSDADDQAGPASVPPPAPAESPRRVPDISGRDMRDTLGKMMARGTTPAAEAEHAPAPQKPAPAPVRAAPRPVPEEEPVEIIDEDPKAALRKGKPAKKVVVSETTEEVPAMADGDEKIISVDQITDLSGLILPKGATFKIDEISLHGRINAFEGTGTSALPVEFAEIWKKEF